MRWIIGACLPLVLAGCSGPSLPEVVEDHAPVSGVADVVGQVLSASGEAIVGAVTIRCGGGEIHTTVPTDARGHYHAALLVSRTGRLPCEFTSAGIRVDTTIGFGPAGLPHALQVVDLRAR